MCGYERCPYTAASDGSPETQSSSDGGRVEMVSGVEDIVFHTDSNSDETRGEKVWTLTLIFSVECQHAKVRSR